MKWLKKCITRVIYKVFALWIRGKTHLSKTQCEDFARCLLHYLYDLNGLHFRRNKIYLRLLFDGMDWKAFHLTEEQLRKGIVHPTYKEDYCEPIGQWFTIDSENTYADAPKIENTDRITYYASGREPLLAVANLLSAEKKTVLMPYFICGTVYQPFVNQGWEIAYYKIDENLKIDKVDILEKYEKYKPSLVVFMEYSGMDLTDDDLQIISKLKESGCVTMVDRTQNIYSDRRDEGIDFYYGSLRKWFCCPDGGYLERNGSIALPPAPENCSDVYAVTCAAMMFANGLARQRKITQYLTIGVFFRFLSMRFVCGQVVRERSMSAYARAVYYLERQKDAVYIQRRKENGRYIFDRVANFSAIRPVCPDLSRFTSAPFYFQVYADDREKLCKYLLSKGIMAWPHTEKAKNFTALDAQTEYMFGHTLYLPCDQRYTLEDMRILCDALEEYEMEKRDKK